MVQAKKTAAYRVIAGPGGKRGFRFYCDISGELCCVTKSIRADTEDEALEIAWETEGRWAFDRCPQCGRYVSSAMFKDRKSTRLNSSHRHTSRMPSSA